MQGDIGRMDGRDATSFSPLQFSSLESKWIEFGFNRKMAIRLMIRLFSGRNNRMDKT